MANRMRRTPIALLTLFALAAGCSRLIGADFDRPLADGGGHDVKDLGAAGDSGGASDLTNKEAGDGPAPTTDGDAAEARDGGDGEAGEPSDGHQQPDAPSGDGGDGGPRDDSGHPDVADAGDASDSHASDSHASDSHASDSSDASDADAGDSGSDSACACDNDHICCDGICKAIDPTNCFACGVACDQTRPVCAVDVQACVCSETSCPSGQVCVAGACLRPGVLPLAARQPWTRSPYYGAVQTSFADVDGDRRADAIAVNTWGVTVYQASPNGGFVYKGWTTTSSFYGAHGTSFADVNGDGCADAIAIGDTNIIVRRSNCANAFGASEVWGPRDTNALFDPLFADVNGDGCADVIDDEPGGVVVRVAIPCPASPGTAARFDPTPAAWTDNAYNGSDGTFFADVTGDGKADAIVLNRYAGTTGITVRRSDGTRFLPNEGWADDTLDGASALLFGDVTGDGMDDLVAVKADGAYMLRSDRWFLGQSEPLSDWPFTPSGSIAGQVFALADVTGDGRADLIQVNDDAVWVNVRVDRQIPIRFVQLVPDAASALPPEQLAGAVAAANAVHRPAGVQFFIGASEVVTSPALADLTAAASASPADLAAATNPFNPACDLGADLAGLPALQQLAAAATRCALDGEILVYIAHVTSSTAQLPWEGKAFFIDPADLTAAAPSPFRLAHELGHYLGLPHVFGCCGDTALSHSDLVAGNLEDPSTGGPGSLSLFWDLVYAPSATSNIMFNNAADAASFESSLMPIQATATTTDLTSGWYCPSADASRSCDASAPAGTICLQVSDPQGQTQNYCSGNPDLKGLGLRLADDTPTVNVMGLGYRPPVPDPSDVTRRQPTLSLSQVEQIQRVLTYDVDTPILDSTGQVITGGRPHLGR
jgi:hypothetical protein